MPVVWPGFHALCIERVQPKALRVLLHNKSGGLGGGGTRALEARIAEAGQASVREKSALLDELVAKLEAELKASRHKNCAKHA